MNDLLIKARSDPPASIERSCPDCGTACALRIGEAHIRGQLKWFESVNCEVCGLRTEADGAGIAPAYIRDELMKLQGTWCLQLVPVTSKVHAAQVLRESLGLDIGSSLQAVRSADGCVYSGTKTECLWLSERLAQIGETPEISPLTHTFISAA